MDNPVDARPLPAFPVARTSSACQLPEIQTISGAPPLVSSAAPSAVPRPAPCILPDRPGVRGEAFGGRGAERAGALEER